MVYARWSWWYPLSVPRLVWLTCLLLSFIPPHSQRIGVEQSRRSLPCRLHYHWPFVCCVLVGVSFLSRNSPPTPSPLLPTPPFPPSLPTYYLADADFYNLHEINKCTSALLTVLHVHRFSFSPCLFPLQKIPLLFR